MGGSFDPNSLLNFLNASQGNSSGYQTPPPDQMPTAPPSAPPSGGNGGGAPPAPQQPQLGPRLTGIKGYLSNILYNMGETAKAQAGMPTDRQIQVQNMQLENQRMQAQANALESQAKAQLFGAQAGQLGQMVTLPNGVQVPFSIAQKAFPAYITGELGKEGRIGAAQVQALARNSQVVMKAAYQPDGSLGVGLYDKLGNFKGYADNAIVPAGYLEKIHQGQTFKVNADGTLESIPTTSVSKPVIPGAPSTTGTTPATSPGVDPSAAPKITPQTLQQQAAAKAVTNAKPVIGSGGKPFQAPSAADVGSAFDPKTNQYFITTRSDANSSGYQNFQKSTPAQIENDRQLNNRLADVQQKIERYANTFNQDLSDRDKADMSALISDNHFKLGMLGTELPTGFIGQIVSSNLFQNMSPTAQQRFLAYVNAREAMSGYQRVLTGSGRGNEKTLQLQLDVLANPLWQPQAAGEAFNQFRENLKIAGQGLPRMKGVQTAGDVENRLNQSNQNTPPLGARIRDYTQLK